MSKEDIINYVMNTPSNTNPNVLGTMLDSISGIVPTGKKVITDTNETDVAAYSIAQVIDQNLVAENIKKDIEILGTIGTYEGGSNNFSTANIAVKTGQSVVNMSAPVVSNYENQIVGRDDLLPNRTTTRTIVLFNGSARIGFFKGTDIPELTVDSGSATIYGSGFVVVTGDCIISAN